jgi:hypothetical protein
MTFIGPEHLPPSGKIGQSKEATQKIVVDLRLARASLPLLYLPDLFGSPAGITVCSLIVPISKVLA